MKLAKLTLIAILLACLAASRSLQAAGLLEMKIDGKAYQGRLVAYDAAVCWLMDRDGRLHQLDVRRVSEHRAVSSEFRPFSHGEVRDRLRRELGKDFEIAGTSHYLVCAAKGKAQAFAPIFEEIYRSFYRYLSTRRLIIEQPEFPLVAIVFADRGSFVKYARRDGVSPAPGLMGYYKLSSNRVALFDPGDTEIQAGLHNDTATKMASLDNRFSNYDTLISPFDLAQAPLANFARHGNIQANLQDTIVHETTHQVAFNAGLHSRIAESPSWVVEGIATVFESPGVRESRGTTAASRINRDRFIWFGNYAQARRKPHSLAAFVSSEALFQSAPLDAYSEAWALSFFLVETRSSGYSKYLKLITARDPLKPYGPNDRLADFQQSFGKDLDALDVEFRRFIQRLN